MRFTTPGRKAAVIAVLVAVSALLALLFDALHSEAGSVVLTVLQVIAWYLVSRLFRGPGEPVRAARPWWRMTNRPLLSGVLAAVYGLARRRQHRVLVRRIRQPLRHRVHPRRARSRRALRPVLPAAVVAGPRDGLTRRLGA